MASPLHVVRVGSGPRVLLIHGSAADHATWSIQLASPLKDRFTLVAYDRRPDAPSVEAHAEDARAVLADGDEPALVVGSSFGAVIALDLMRRFPTACAGAVLIEPPMAASDDALAASADFLDTYDQRVADAGGPAAAEWFLRTVLGDAIYERMPRAYQQRAQARWAEIRADSAALIAYRPRYAELGAVTQPVRLLGGGRSPPYFRATLDALAGALPRAQLHVIPGVGHMLHAEAPRQFAQQLLELGAELWPSP